MTKKLQLIDLSKRHPGLTKAIGDTYAEAASVCLSRHHESPIDLDAQYRGNCTQHDLLWKKPDERVRRAHGRELAGRLRRRSQEDSTAHVQRDRYSDSARRNSKRASIPIL